MLIVTCLGVQASTEPVKTSAELATENRHLIGATAWVTIGPVQAKLLARVDTGAESCSLHAEEIVVPKGKEKMTANVGKAIRFRVIDNDGETHWIESTIHSTVVVKTSEERERRYKVWVDMACVGIDKRVCVTLNDRSHMEFPVLVGRNYLKDDFLVDVNQAAKE
ncbi:putative ATP-dependent zinc protease [Botrimarina hoheduenensis]|uniref:putative ATP-dependent zinc protease n=1 Tax=Botrimarina hoheduenensis TaxID=2528000 RepID=UPI0018D3F312|nr:RimK/LysX family protein [Botrimarina hoheduenensis]